MAKKQLFGIKYPFQNESESSYYLDLNMSYKEKVRSEITHIIFTPKGQRYRMPDFGTDLIKYIFEPNDDETWGKIKSEIKEQVTKYLPRVSFQDINMYRDEENGNHLYAEIKYIIKKGDSEEFDNIMLRID
jgi:phage baseplate assembly protein W